MSDNKLNAKQLKFCKEYIFDWNATKAAERAGYSKRSAGSIGSRLLKNVNILDEIERQKLRIEENAGLSKSMAVAELKKFAFHSFDDLHNTWIERKEFESLSADVKACIQEIDTKVIKRNVGTEENPEMGEVEHIKIKLVDKRGALQDLAKMLGWNNPEKIIQHTVNHDAAKLDKEGRRELNDELENEF